jgi:flagellum-specific peptidoglycan hydrolase FlgJ
MYLSKRIFHILSLVMVLLLVSCGGSKSTIQTKKSTSKITTRSVKPPRATVITKTTETLVATSKVATTSDLIKDYIATYRGIAQDNMRQYGIPASITLAQGILESGSGQGGLSQSANNHFGIKCHKEWTGPSVRHDDDAAQECFRKYDHPRESYRDHSLFLTSRSRYASLFSLPKDDYSAWAHGLKNAGYATDPKYPAKLISLIERYQLHQYDAEVLGKEVVITSSIPVPVADGSTYKVVQGDTLYSIARKFNTTVDVLKKNNKLNDYNIAIGQVLKVK